MDDNTETRIDELDLYVIPNSYPPKYNPRKVADYCREMGIEDPSTLTKEQLEPFRLFWSSAELTGNQARVARCVPCISEGNPKPLQGKGRVYE